MNEVCPCCGNALQVRRDVQFTIESRTLLSSDFAIVFSKMEAALFDLLWRGRNAGRIATKQALWDHLYDDDPDGGPDLKVIDIWIMRMRRKLACTPIEIVTSWGEGWFLRTKSAKTAPGAPLTATKMRSASGEAGQAA
jgi:DNA-binding response OmpR family regulator